MVGARRSGTVASAGRVPVFISASSKEGARARAFAEAVEGSGICKVEDRWFDGCEAWSRKDATYTREQQSEFAEFHREYLQRCRIYWLLYPFEHSDGALFEFGFASAHQHHVGSWWLWTVVSGANSSRSIFTASASYRDADDFAALHEVIRRASEILCQRSDRKVGATP